MSLTQGVFAEHSIVQQIIPPPYFLNMKENVITQSSLYSSEFRHTFRIFSELLMLVIIFPICILRLSWLVLNWKSFTSQNVEQLIVYGMISFVILVYVPVYVLFHTKSDNIIATINETCNLGSSFNTSVKNHKRFKIPLLGKRSIMELFVYGFAIPIILLIPAFAAAPIALSYLPFQLIFGNNFPVNIISALLYGIATAHGALSVLSLLLIIILFLENLIEYSKTTYYKSSAYNFVNGRRFVLCYIRFRTLQVIFKCANILFAPFLTNLIFIGILLATSGVYVTFKMYDQLHIIMYLCGPALASICFVIAILFTILFGIPYIDSKKFKSYWIRHIRRIEEKKCLKSCQPSGVVLEPYGVMRPTTGLLICDDIIHNTITALLLDSN